LPEGLHLAAILPREDPRDAFVALRYASLAELPATAKIGTSSLRRQCQLQAQLPHAQILSLRGNVNTRLAKLDAGDYDAIILAAAGLKRLDLGYRITETLEPTVSLPAVGQGAIGIECRSDDVALNALLATLHDEATGLCVSAERAMNARLNGGCQVPIAGFAQLAHGCLTLRGLVGAIDGSVLYRCEQQADAVEAEALGQAVADNLLQQGADKILQILFNE
jgi:hydroxymethylbilane synthase